MQRPYAKAGIVELETIFAKARADQKVCKALLQELSFRSTDRAARLKADIDKALTLDLFQQASTARTDDQAASQPVRPAAPRPTLSPVPPLGSMASSTPTSRDGWASRPVTNDPASILSAWTALEVLSPVTYRDPPDMADGEVRRVAPLDGAMPWQPPGEKSRPNKQLFYQVVLGAVRMDEATRALLAAFVDKNQDRVATRGFAAIATVTLDKTGVLVEAGAAIAVSSFAWGLPLALKRDLTGLGSWPEVEGRLNAELDRRLRRVDRDGKPLPLDRRTIDDGFAWLVKELALNPVHVENPTFAIRVYHYWKAPDPPDAPLLGSFFLEDLAAVRALVKSTVIPTVLRSYLGITKPKMRRDVLSNDAVLADAVSPGRFPPGRWSSMGRHPLVLLQQAAVNTAMAELPGVELFPVNGPPGTGKTTLLRDMVAALVVGRAETMCAFADPEKAFTPSGAKPKIGNANVPIYNVANSLRGFEMLVASSNNKAVENVSRELPALKDIAADANGLRYFKTVSDKVGDRTETWGLIAAVLGNAANRFAFREAAWIDPDCGLQTYLAEVAGSPQWIEEPDPAKPGKVRKRRPIVVERERPPRNHRDAMLRWTDARQAFTSKLTEVRAFLAELDTARQEIGTLPSLQTAVDLAATALRNANVAGSNADSRLESASQRAASASQVAERAQTTLSSHRLQQPGFAARLFGLKVAKAWNDSDVRLSVELDDAKRLDRLSAAEVEAARDGQAKARADVGLAQAALRNATAVQEAAKARVARLQAHCKGRMIDTAFFAKASTEKHLTAPWLDDLAHRERDQVFELAIAVHKAFIDAAAVPIRSNLENFFRALIGRNAWQPKTKPHMPALWATLFLVVPVVSTTFASVIRMFGYLPPETLGWLLIDEAGQAVPQAAVGAMMRCKRAVVVGDPLQIEPVTSLPTELAETICSDFDVDPDRWNAPKASVQSVADVSATFTAQFPQLVGSVQVGFPLLVHRRCAEPMFSLSNSVAYANLMVQATPRRQSTIRDVLGPSRWIDVAEGRTEDKYADAEGSVVLDMVRRLAEANVTVPDLFIVTPFVIVAQRIRERLARSGLLSRWDVNPQSWVRDRIGTVHTVQGREADSVIFVLGAPLPAQRGARMWAGGSPNILNVATTRAKENLYVVGSHEAWRSAGVFSKLADRVRRQVANQPLS